MDSLDDTRLYSQRYQVTDLIARGGMAMVYRAQDTLLNRAVALKILYPELSEDPTFVERFRREAQAAANLSHPNIVPVFDWGEDEGTYFIVMELVDGTSLAEVLRHSTTVSPARAAQIAAQVASALGYAHRAGVVHRDVKPGNILITREGLVKVTDFGIAQAVASEDSLAAAGSVMGTATYFSPEQAEGVAVDGRSDVYSLGVVLFEMVVGRPPFIGDTPVEVSAQHVHSVVPRPSDFSPDVPHDLEAIIMESLEKSPHRRYQSADELRADLIRFTEGQPVRAGSGEGTYFGADATRSVAVVAGGERTQAVPVMTGPRSDVPRRRRSRSGWTGFVVALVVVAAAAAGFAWYQHDHTGVTTMPDLLGQSVQQARSTLKSDGFTVDTRLTKSKQPRDTVIGSFPAFGKKVVRGQAVTLRISEGQTSTPVTIQSYIGLSLTDAEAELTAAKLGAKVVPTSNPPTSGTVIPNVVLAQSPQPGTKAQTGDTVTLTVLASGSAYPITSVLGDSVVKATSVLTNQGLVVNGVEGRTCSNTVNSGLVFATLPAAGAPVKAGSGVQLILSSGPCQVVVPGVLGDTEAQATAKLGAQNLVASYSLDPTAVCPIGATEPTVTTQSVPGGSNATYGSTIQLEVCQMTTTTSGPTTGPSSGPTTG